MSNQLHKVADRRSDSDRIHVISRTPLADAWAYLERVEFNYRRSNGQWQTQRREIYHRGHGAAVLLYNLSNRTIVLTRQFRFPDWECGGDGFLIEVPAGIIESDDPAETVRRETEEETGFLIAEPSFLFKAYASPGSVTEQLHYFCAAYEPQNRCGSGGGLVDEGEDIEVLEVDIDEAVRWVSDGSIIDAKSILLIQYAQLTLFKSAAS